MTHKDFIIVDDTYAMVRLSAFEILSLLAGLNAMSPIQGRSRNEVRCAKAIEKLKTKLARVIAEEG